MAQKAKPQGTEAFILIPDKTDQDTLKAIADSMWRYWRSQRATLEQAKCFRPLLAQVEEMQRMLQMSYTEQISQKKGESLDHPTVVLGSSLHGCALCFGQ